MTDGAQPLAQGTIAGMKRLLPVVALVLVAALPGSASAAVCADHPNQASAQRAQDTRDADGDGIYCEALPCPCSRGGGGGGGTSRPTPVARPRPKPEKRAQVISARITSVVDGDTIKVRAFGTKRDFYTVRLIGIDTPETKRPGRPVECAGKRATSRMLRLSFTEPDDTNGDDLYDQEGGDGRRVTLVTDPTQDLFDRYGRLLAYVTTRAGVNLATRMLRDGLAKVYVYRTPFARHHQFRAAQAIARARGRGAWTRCGGNFHKPI